MIDRELLKQVIAEQHEMLFSTAKLVDREVFAKFPSLIKSPFIIVITGIRRCGKSTLLNWIKNQSKDRDYYLNFDDERLTSFSVDDFQVLTELFIELYSIQHTFYFDEIQNIPGWERFIRRLHDAGNKIYITGSNAVMFSQELGTRLTGRYIPVTLYPYSFSEYVQKMNSSLLPFTPTTTKKATIKKLFNNYLKTGGFPEYLDYPLKDYLHTLFENIFYKDIMTRYKLPNEKALRNLLVFLASNVAKNITFNSLKNMIGVSNSNTVAEYCQYFQNSFLCFLVNNFSPSLKSQYGYAKKIYWIDPGFAHVIGFRMSDDAGRLLENIVYLELLRREHEVYFYQEKTECDFLIKEGNAIVAAIQVTASMQNQDTRQREIQGLLVAMRNFNLTEGLILTDNETDQVEMMDEQKKLLIVIRPIWQWLLKI